MPHEVSIIIPVINEPDIIETALTRLKIACGRERPEIVVVDGSCNGTTLKAVSDPEVLCLVSSKGRGHQMNIGARAASGKILVFLHVDTFLFPGAVGLIQEAFKDPAVVGGAFRFGIRSGKKRYRLIEWGVQLRYRLNRIPYGDQAIFIRRNYFHRIGGYPEIPIMEDVALVRRILDRGHKMVLIPRKVSTSARRWEKEGIVYATLRNWTLFCLYRLGGDPEWLARFYR